MPEPRPDEGEGRPAGGPRFRQFGLASVAIDKIFVCVRNREETAVRLYSEQGGPVDLDGEEARLFIAFVKDHASDAAPGGVTLIYGPPHSPRPGTPTRIEPGPVPRAGPG